MHFFLSQIEGAFVQGLGLDTQEELNYSSEGVLHTRGPEQYKIPSVTDIPEELRMSLLSPTLNPKAISSSKVSFDQQPPRSLSPVQVISKGSIETQNCPYSVFSITYSELS